MQPIAFIFQNKIYLTPINLICFALNAERYNDIRPGQCIKVITGNHQQGVKEEFNVE